MQQSKYKGLAIALEISFEFLLLISYKPTRTNTVFRYFNFPSACFIRLNPSSIFSILLANEMRMD